MLDDVRDVDGVRTAEGFVSGYALLTDNDGKAILTTGGAPDHGLHDGQRREPPR